MKRRRKRAKSGSSKAQQDTANALWPNVFSETAQWLCRVKDNDLQFKISGPLAQILTQYEDDYDLSFLTLHGDITHEHSA